MIAAILLLAAAAGEPEVNCVDPQAQQEMNFCAAREFERVDAEMNVQWRATVAAMKEADRSIDRTYDKEPGYYETLLAAQRAWLVYREKHCLGESFEARGGSLAPLLHGTCMTELTKVRIRQLKELIEGEN